jgi:hypothetical protein
VHSEVHELGEEIIHHMIDNVSSIWVKPIALHLTLIE